MLNMPSQIELGDEEHYSGFGIGSTGSGIGGVEGSTANESHVVRLAHALKVAEDAGQAYDLHPELSAPPPLISATSSILSTSNGIISEKVFMSLKFKLLIL